MKGVLLRPACLCRQPLRHKYSFAYVQATAAGSKEPRCRSNVCVGELTSLVQLRVIYGAARRRHIGTVPAQVQAAARSADPDSGRVREQKQQTHPGTTMQMHTGTL